MPDPQPVPVAPNPAPPTVPVEHRAPVAARSAPRRPGPLGRLLSIIVSVGLAWALTVAITAWLLGLFLTRG